MKGELQPKNVFFEQYVLVMLLSMFVFGALTLILQVTAVPVNMASTVL